jgi:methylmalonyl-CoA mutase C-terminal domain/subunit
MSPDISGTEVLSGRVVMVEPQALRVLVAKVGLDGHDRGVKVVARLLRDAGVEVIYTGLFQTPETVAAAAVDEDVDVVGLSMLSGAHMTLAPLVVEAIRARGVDIPVVIGGIVPPDDVAALKAAGVAEILGPGAGGDDVVAAVRRAASQSQSA